MVNTITRFVLVLDIHCDMHLLTVGLQWCNIARDPDLTRFSIRIQESICGTQKVGKGFSGGKQTSCMRVCEKMA